MIPAVIPASGRSRTGPRSLASIGLLVAILVGSVLAGGGVAAAATAPAAPTSAAATTVGAGSVTLTWSPPAGNGGSAITGYVVRRDGVNAQGSSTWSTTVSASTRSQTFTKLVPGRTYSLSVRARSAVGLGAAATVKVTAATTPSAPVVPGAVPGTSAGGTSFSALVSWTPPTADGGSPITGYRVTRLGYDIDGTGPWSTTVGPGVRSFTMTRLGPKTYYFTVAAINVVGTGPAATTLFPYSVPNYVHKPTIVSTSSDPVTGSVTVTWDYLYYGNHAAMPDVVQVSRDGTDTSGAGPWSTTVPVDSRSFTFTRLKPGVPYTFSVQVWRKFDPDDKRGETVTVTL